tara:strand:+ start:810 stop:1499 length:690 start_codon:yes stop_codon:yes gene_type:complete
MIIFITGSKGYIGSNIKDYLKNKKFNIKCNKKKVTLKSNFKKKKIDYIIHCANIYFSNQSKKIFFTNYVLSKKIYNELNNSIYANQKRIIFINLNTIYINNKKLIKNSNYIKSKAKFSNYVKKNKKKRLIFIDLLLPTVFGKNGNNKDFYSFLKKKLILNKNIYIKEPYRLKKYVSILSVQKKIYSLLKYNNYKSKYIKLLQKSDFKCNNLEFARYLKKKMKSKSKIIY